MAGPFDKKMAKSLKRIRLEAGLSQRELGAKLKQPQAYIYTCENSKRRVAVNEFVQWVKACGEIPQKAFAAYMKSR